MITMITGLLLVLSSQNIRAQEDSVRYKVVAIDSKEPLQGVKISILLSKGRSIQRTTNSAGIAYIPVEYAALDYSNTSGAVLRAPVEHILWEKDGYAMFEVTTWIPIGYYWLSKHALDNSNLFAVVGLKKLSNSYGKVNYKCEKRERGYLFTYTVEGDYDRDIFITVNTEMGTRQFWLAHLRVGSIALPVEVTDVKIYGDSSSSLPQSSGGEKEDSGEAKHSPPELAQQTMCHLARQTFTVRLNVSRTNKEIELKDENGHKVGLVAANLGFRRVTDAKTGETLAYEGATAEVHVADNWDYARFYAGGGDAQKNHKTHTTEGSTVSTELASVRVLDLNKAPFSAFQDPNAVNIYTSDSRDSSEDWFFKSIALEVTVREATLKAAWTDGGDIKHSF